MKKIAIIGAGILGLATGIELLKSGLRLKVVILEKEKDIGLHASGRNSGVLHAGFYYSPDSLKAKFCKTGNRELRELCKSYNIPINNCGKVVVTKSTSEIVELKKLYNRGIANGVEVELHDESDLKKYEPLAKTKGSFLWSPTTAVSSPKLIIEALKAEFLQRGGVFQFNNNIKLIETNNGIYIADEPKSFDYIVNCAGTNSEKIANQVGLSEKYLTVPFLGAYIATENRNLPIKTLIYPVPHPVNPFLGTHFTITIDGITKIGPTAIPVLGREQYTLLDRINFKDAFKITSGYWKIVKGKEHNFISIFRDEAPKLNKNNLVKSGLELIRNDDSFQKLNWQKKPAGIRAQLVEKSSGKLVQDFLIEKSKNSCHVLNLVSPGWTSALPFSRWLVSEHILPQIT